MDGNNLDECLYACSLPTQPTACQVSTVQEKRLFAMQQKLGLILEKEDEMDCLVGGTNFLLKAIRNEAFTYANNTATYASINGMQPGVECMSPVLLSAM